MNLKCNMLIILSVSVFLILQGLALSADKSVIVGFHEMPGPSEKTLIHGSKGIIKRTYRIIPAMAVKLSQQGIEKIKKNKKVAYVEDNGIFKAVEPLQGVEYTNSWGVKHIRADIAHASGNKGTDVKVAVIDTGISYTHPDLDDNFVSGINFVQKPDGTVDPLDFFDNSWNSHGTHIAGVIAAEGNGIGVIGVAPEANLYAVRVLDGGGFGLLSWILAGIEWAILNGMDIANLSLEGPYFQSLKDVCDAAYGAGVLLVAAGGNTHGGAVRYPAAYNSVIAVTGTTMSDMRAYFSPVGPEVELAAPGLDILSTVSGGSYDLLSGTSQASPHVAGTAALFLTSDLQDVNGDGMINNKDVRHMLRITAIDLGDPGQDTVYGFGLVDASAASLPADILSFTITRTSGMPAADTETVPVSGALYKITIENNGLSKVKIDVFEEGVYQKELSSSYSFGNKKPQEATFSIDADGTSYDVTFTPFGKPGTSADIVINTL